MRPLWPADFDSRQGPSLIPLTRHLAGQQASQTVRRRGPLPHMPKFAVGALCAHALPPGRFFLDCVSFNSRGVAAECYSEASSWVLKRGFLTSP